MIGQEGKLLANVFKSGLHNGFKIGIFFRIEMALGQHGIKEFSAEAIGAASGAIAVVGKSGHGDLVAQGSNQQQGY
jgi:hypothetical protein